MVLKYIFHLYFKDDTNCSYLSISIIIATATTIIAYAISEVLR